MWLRHPFSGPHARDTAQGTRLPTGPQQLLHPGGDGPGMWATLCKMPGHGDSWDRAGGHRAGGRWGWRWPLWHRASPSHGASFLSPFSPDPAWCSHSAICLFIFVPSACIILPRMALRQRPCRFSACQANFSPCVAGVQWQCCLQTPMQNRGWCHPTLRLGPGWASLLSPENAGPPWKKGPLLTPEHPLRQRLAPGLSPSPWTLSHGLAAAPTVDGSGQGATDSPGPAGMGTLAINPQGSWLLGLLWLQDKLSWAVPL